MKRATDFASGGIAMGMQHARAAVGTLAGECELSCFTVELRAPGNEFLNALGTFFHEDAGSFGVDDAVAGRKRVLDVKADLVFVAESDSDAALSVLRGRVGDFLLREYENATALCQLDGGAQSSNSGADNDEIRLLGNRL